ncbi:follicle-stimulating hormone receptor-like isoform X2 [Periplaneta americana]
MLCLLGTFLLAQALTAMTESDWVATVRTLEDQSAMIRSGANWRCDCWNITDHELLMECRCTGQGLQDVPSDLNSGVQGLILSGLGIRILKKNSLQPYRHSLQDITLNDLKELEVIELGTFRRLHRLRTIYISEAPRLKSLPASIFGELPATFYALRIMRTGLQSFPDLSDFPQESIVQMIDLESNRITKIEPNSVRVKADHLILNYNAIESVDGWAFNGSEIAKLSLKGNRELSHLSNEAFFGLKSLTDIDLSETAITHLPTGGLEELDILRIQDTKSLKVIPSVYSFEHLKEAWLTYSFHCCAFKFPARHDPRQHALHQANLAKIRNCHGNGQRSRRTVIQGDSWGEAFLSTASWGPAYEDGHGLVLPGFHSDQAPLPEEDSAQWRHADASSMEGLFHQTTARVPTEQLQAMCGNLSVSSVNVKCRPEPDALNPCEDIMGLIWLRVSVWFVVVAAVLGNLAVLLVLLSNALDLTVPKFLMCHLAFADLCMGAYLLILAVMDVHSSGVYFNFAYDWQIGAGCQVAGFLTVFASQLSIYTLSILTLERWFAITYAIYLNKRLKLRSASKIMAGGWLYSIAMAALPLFGISSYSTTSICLPMETRDVKDVAYLVCLLVVNGLAFVVICICYAQIYLSLGHDTRRSGGSASAGEMTVAKKMALLVFTDFACWAPIAFFGLTAVAGYPLIDVTRSKILLVFFYPLNSCANPYLYAILTAQYRKDLFMLLARYGLCMRTAQQYKMTYSLATTNNSNPVPLVQRSVVVVAPQTNTTHNGNARTGPGQEGEVFV